MNSKASFLLALLFAVFLLSLSAVEVEAFQDDQYLVPAVETMSNARCCLVMPVPPFACVKFCSSAQEAALLQNQHISGNEEESNMVNDDKQGGWGGDGGHHGRGIGCRKCLQ
ncbi:uncharacterized protein LOC8280451 isoform X2 [Ricinus communis]|uniref:uncharacterized protein LOC8280451 isoform X2 n=1 Tax=Ricinus communis TaxID=3988 RepID=UPI0007722396|nr:uncharacterized protein LOC8280451 isoform X2 [Ricinus communis]|eukprot:XP_015583451.1 uncharacterized protein LOC8280451 isoform X2 [Ricinus communis]